LEFFLPIFFSQAEEKKRKKKKKKTNLLKNPLFLLVAFKFSKLLILQINRDNILFIYLFIDVHKHTHTYIHTDFLSVIFKEGKYSN